MSEHAPALLAVAILAGCAVAPARPRREAPILSTPSRPATRAPLNWAAQPERGADASSSGVDALGECASGEGDPRVWRAHEPIAEVDHPHCFWTVARDATGLRARLRDWSPRSHPLPFEPSSPPRHRVVRCASEGPPPELPALLVRDYLAAEGGFLVAYDSGEWGGGVAFHDGAGILRQWITEENGVGLVETPGGILAFTGLAHLTMDVGHMLRLSRSGGLFRARAITLPGSPRVIRAASDGSILVVTSRSLVRVTGAGSVEHLHTGHWEMLYPDSMEQEADGTLYLGARSVVVRLRPAPAGYTEEWLAPYAIKRLDPEPDAG